MKASIYLIRFEFNPVKRFTSYSYEFEYKSVGIFREKHQFLSKQKPINMNAIQTLITFCMAIAVS